MGNVIPWSQIHPSIKSEEPFLAVVVVDSHRQICVSELIEFDPETLDNPDQAAPELVAAAQSAAARVAAAYRTRRKRGGSETATPRPARVTAGGLRLLQGGKAAG